MPTQEQLEQCIAEQSKQIADLLKKVDTFEKERADAKAHAQKRTSIAAGFVTRLFIGKLVHQQFRSTWDAWSLWLRNGCSKPWPEESTRDLGAAVVRRVTRIGIFGILVAIFPSVFLGIQTYHMARQSKHMNVQTEHMDEQTKLIKQQDEKLRIQTEEMSRQSHFMAYEQTFSFRDKLLKPPKHNGEFEEPDMSVVSSIVILGKRELSIVEDALRPLIESENKTVVMGASRVLALAGSKDLSNTNLNRVNLFRANLSGANLYKAELIEAMLGLANLRQANLTRANLRGTNLAAAKLNGAGLGVANLQGANLRGALLIEASLNGTILREANLIGANLNGANLAEANLNGADLTGADLSRADLYGANLLELIGWKDVSSWNNANIYGVRKAPPGFREHVLEHGGVEVPPEM